MYTNGQCTFGDVIEKFCEGFKEFLESVKSIRSNAADHGYGYLYGVQAFRAPERENHGNLHQGSLTKRKLKPQNALYFRQWEYSNGIQTRRSALK